MGSAKPVLARDAKASNRILIVDDLPEMRKLIRTYIEEETDFRVCGEAIDGWTPSIKRKI
jgi:CheY-like chemotaxis protein